MWITVAGGARVRRVAWWVLLTCTVIGLASMHTLGHGRAAASASSAVSVLPASSAFSPLHSAPFAGLHSIGSRVGALLGGSHPEDHDPGGGHGAAWGVCLAVLVALTAAVLLLAWLLLWRRAGFRTGLFPFTAGRVITRAPPRSGVGLRLSSTSVLRI